MFNEHTLGHAACTVHAALRTPRCAALSHHVAVLRHIVHAKHAVPRWAAPRYRTMRSISSLSGASSRSSIRLNSYRRGQVLRIKNSMHFSHT